MAQILDTSTNLKYPVRAHHTLGRSAEKVDTAVAGDMVSRIHAALEWNGQNWSLRDLSRNGTWLRDTRVSPKETVPLSVGEDLHFGHPGGPAWQLVEDSPPRSLLVGITPDTATLELSPYLFLPNDEEPRMVVTYSSERQCWFRQSVTDSSRPEVEDALLHREVLTCADKQWRVFLADSADATKQQVQEKQLDEFEFVFDLSLDEENTGLRLEHQHRQQAVNLGERSHHYLLLHLARQRAVEASRGLDQRSQGWIDSEQLARDLGVDMSHINILNFSCAKATRTEPGRVLRL